MTIQWREYLVKMCWGRQENHRGRGCGRNNRRGTGHGTSPWKNNSNQKELKFIPYNLGRHNGLTYDTVMEHIMQTIQKTYKYGIDIVEVHQDQELDKESRLCDLRCGALPIKKEKDEVDDYDVAIYIKQMKECRERWQIYEDNKNKACGLIMSYCSKEMVNRIEEVSEYTRIKKTIHTSYWTRSRRICMSQGDPNMHSWD